MADILARPGQTLEEHLVNVSKLASRFGAKINLSEMLRVAGLLHDYGKVQPEFQTYLFDENANRGDVEHSVYGAVKGYAAVKACPRAAEIIGNVIAAHHGKLYDFLSPGGETAHHEKMESTAPLGISFEPLERELRLNVEALEAEYKKVFDSMHEKERAFGLFMLTGFVYSCLVDADRLDAFLNENQLKYEEKKPDWNGMLENLSRRLGAFKSETEMDKLRAKVSDGCALAGQRGKGIYKLEVPTGGGKTLASLRFALEHAKRHGMDRIIYVIPYLSILSQTANEIRKALNADEQTVLEHHSGVLAEPDKYENYKLHTDRWDAPVILTTQVQFLESVFSSKGSDLRKLHNMANAVFIFDEAQSIPIKCIYLFNGAVNFLQRLCGGTVLLCTATQPQLDKVIRPVRLADSASVADAGPAPERTGIVNALVKGGYSYPDLASFVTDKHKTSTLVIVNTKAAAKNLYEELQNLGAPVLHLSTNMCSAHRDAVIEELRRRLDPESPKPVICVSTQLIEAGVDISLECVIRDIAGLDSIYQAAGRCNRHGEYGEVKPVYVVNIHGENLDKLADIKIGAEITYQLFDDGNPSIEEFYRKYFLKQENAMNYPVKNGDLYDWLTLNKYGKGAYRSRTDIQGKEAPVMLPAIRSAAEEFFIIDRGRTDVIAPYGEGHELLDRYSRTEDIAKKRKLLQKLGKYGVSLFKYQLDALDKAGALFCQGGVKGLEKGFYDEARGVDLNGQHEFLCE